MGVGGNLSKQGPLISDYTAEENDISSKQLLMANSPSRSMEVHRPLHSHDGRFIGPIVMLPSPMVNHGYGELLSALAVPCPMTSVCYTFHHPLAPTVSPPSLPLCFLSLGWVIMQGLK